MSRQPSATARVFPAARHGATCLLAAVAFAGACATSPAPPAASGSVGSTPGAGAATSGEPLTGSFELLSTVTLPAGMSLPGGARFGGLSGVAWDEATDEYWAVSDDPSEHAPARVVRFRLGAAAGGGAPDGHLRGEDFHLLEPVTLRNAAGVPFARDTIDGEGVALAARSFFISSEGNARSGVAPFVAEFRRDGSWIRDLPLAGRYRPEASGGVVERGIAHNEGPEALSATPDGRALVAGFEGALVQEGPKAAPGIGAWSRLRRFDLVAGGAPREFFYPLDAVSRSASPAGGLQLNGLVELLALGDEEFLALEREFVFGEGYRIRLHRISLAGATDVALRDGAPDASVSPVKKRLLMDFADLGIALTNFEGMTLGPKLADGRRLLLVVADDNFASYGETTVLLAFALDLATSPTVARLQGAAHRSPWEGRHVFGLEGVVTAVDRAARGGGFWVEAPAGRRDGDEATSEGLFVADPGTAVSPGQRVALSGRVEEVATGGGLPVTRLGLRSLDATGGDPALPPPVALWRDGGARARVPDGVDDDGLAAFEPFDDAIDFWESLEGMRVEIPPSTVVGPRSGFGELMLLPDAVAPGVERTAVGGMVLRAPPGSTDREAAPYLDRIFVGRRLARIPDASVGDRSPRPVVGVVDASFSNYKVWPLGELTLEPAAGRCGAGERAGFAADASRLTIGTFNVENLSAAGPVERFAQLASTIVEGMGGPAILALQEVQDDSGPQKGADGVVSSERTLAALTAAIAAAGGPGYEPVWIDPELDREGGQPGGNIRVAFLFDPHRVAFDRRGRAGAIDAAVLEKGPGAAPRLAMNPSRVAPRSAAFTLATGEGVRRSLVAEFRFRGRPVFVVNNHWSSKFDDDRPFGGTQPPRRPTGAKRLAQGREVRSFAEHLLGLDAQGRLVVIGDLNDLEWSAPVEEFARPPLRNLVLDLPRGDRYSFNFEGSSQLIDHVVVSPALAAGAEIDIIHRNADCDDALRSSDHDPIVVRFSAF